MPRHAQPPARQDRSRPRRSKGRWSTVGLGLTLLLAVTGVSAPAAGGLLTSASTSCPAGTTAQTPLARVNLGGPALTLGSRTWSAYPPAQGAATVPVASGDAGPDIRGTRHDALYRTAHTGPFAFELPVPAAGRYVTRLHFAETELAGERKGGRGKRVFDVNLESGRPELRRFDVAAAAGGGNRAVVKTLTVHVSDGALLIEGVPVVGTPVLSGIEVLRQHPRGTCVPETTPAPTSEAPAATAEEAPAAAAEAPAPAPEPAPATGEAAPGTAAKTPEAAPRASAPAAPAQPAAPAAGPATGPLGVDSGRPFSPSSAWNTPIPANAAVDPGSAAMIRSVAPSNRATANLYAYGDPVFTATAASPLVKVDCTEDWGTCDLEKAPQRIPADAKPTTGSDGRMIVVDLVAGTSCDYWQASRSGSGWSVGWGTCAALDGDGRGPAGGATGGGVNTLAGVVRTFEMRNLHIPHALSIATNNSCSGVFRYPATKTDGQSSRSDCIPEGARLQLDPSIDVDAIPGITPGEKAVARALQTYGAINRDNCGSNICVSFETPTGKADPYPAAGFTGDYYTMPHIPWTQMRVVK